MKPILIVLAAISLSGCTKNVSGYLVSTANKAQPPEFEIYKDKATDRLMLTTLRRTPDEAGNYRKLDDLTLKKSDDGKSYIILQQGQQIGEIIPRENQKFQIKFALGGGEFTYYEPKDKIKELPSASLKKITDYHEKRALSLGENATMSFVRSFDLDPRTNAHTATTNLLKDHVSKLKPQIEFSKPVHGKDYLMHTEFLVNVTVSYPEIESTSQPWLGCDDGFKYWQAQKVCIMCPKDADGYSKKGNDYLCTKSAFFSSKVLGKAEHSQPTNKALRIHSRMLKHQYTVVGLQAKEGDDFNFHLKDETANGQPIKDDRESREKAFSFTGEFIQEKSQAAH
jgi:hypothetical protein